MHHFWWPQIMHVTHSRYNLMKQMILFGLYYSNHHAVLHLVISEQVLCAQIGPASCQSSVFFFCITVVSTLN